MSRPQHTRADILNDLGVSLRYGGDAPAAGRAFLRALSSEPGHTTAAANLSAMVSGGILVDPDARMATLDALWAYVRADETDPVRWAAFAQVLRTVRVDTPESATHVMPVLLACLLQEDLDHQGLTGMGLSVVRHHPEVAPLMETAEQGPGAMDLLLARSSAWPTLAHPALRLLLRRTVMPDLTWERLFTRVRRAMALGLASHRLPGPQDRLEEVAFALAHQGLANGYVWAQDGEEMAAVESLAHDLAASPLGYDPLDRVRVAMVGAYVPLHTLDLAGALETWAAHQGRPSLEALIRTQVKEPREEREIQGMLPTLGGARWPFPEQVREMYGERPYPRWTRLPRPPQRPLATVLEADFPWAPVGALARVEHPRILVAGCGTGQHLLHTAVRFKGSRVVGLDLSRASLAYAWRKALEMGATDVSLVHGDILDLAGWPEPFHVVECSGVLHHLEDPMAGWRVLTDILAPGGFMKIGLYSATARRSVVAARDIIARHGWGTSEEDIREARPILADRLGAGSGAPPSWPDFYSMHACRDLLFRVHEHLFTLPDIARALEELRLVFVGWEGLSEAVLDQVQGPGGPPSLEAWHAFELEHPETFSGMYHFWVTKPLSPR